MNFETVIGLEVHVELNTNSKIFSPTSAHFGNEQNTNTNVIDWSFPGVLPCLEQGCCGRWNQGRFGAEYGYPPAHAL